VVVAAPNPSWQANHGVDQNDSRVASLPALEITMHLDKSTLTSLGLFAVLLFGIFVWIVGILLLLEVTRQLLDTLSYVMDIAQMS
jgi:hypothetical protein